MLRDLAVLKPDQNISKYLISSQTSSNMFKQAQTCSQNYRLCLVMFPDVFSICVTVFWCVWLACHCLRCTLEHWDIERPAKNLLKSYCVYMYTIVYVYSYIMLNIYIYNLYILCIYIWSEHVRTHICKNHQHIWTIHDMMIYEHILQ